MCDAVIVQGAGFEVADQRGFRKTPERQTTCTLERDEAGRPIDLAFVQLGSAASPRELNKDLEGTGAWKKRIERSGYCVSNLPFAGGVMKCKCCTEQHGLKKNTRKTRILTNKTSNKQEVIEDGEMMIEILAPEGKELDARGWHL